MGFTDLARLSRGFSNLLELSTELFPPNLQDIPAILDALFETIKIAFVGTITGFVLSIPFAALALRTAFPSYITSPIRALLALIRTIPALFWAVIFVIAVGLGPLAGTLAVTVYSLGYLSKLYYEAFEAVDQDTLDALRCAGASSLALVRYAVIPESLNTIFSQLLFMFEYNVRASAVLGFVGAGGVGFLMINYIETLRYSSLTTIIMLTLMVVVAVDYISGRLRKLVLPGIRLKTPQPLTTKTSSRI